MQPRVLFTPPWDPLVVRRGDALGLRAVADQFADAVAPGLSNRIHDGRWVTILAWCLTRSYKLFYAHGGRSVQTPTEQAQRYAWLRPLELLWVARTIAIAEEDSGRRSLAGQRRVRPWYAAGKRSPRFGMTPEQLQAYRQSGMYGGYRLALRRWPELTLSGDGWTPGPTANTLAEWLDRKLDDARPSWELHFAEKQKLRKKPEHDDDHGWWLKHYWPHFEKKGPKADLNTLPRPRSDFSRLPEWKHLRPLVFGPDPAGLRRQQVALAVEEAEAPDHLEVCARLADAFSPDPVIALLPRFSHLADAGMELMDLIARGLGGQGRVPLTHIAADPEAAALCAELREAAAAWPVAGGAMQPRHLETVHRFAGAINSQRPERCLQILLEYHELHGGGLRWFVLRDGKVEARTPPRAGSSRYRFRLWSLCRLGAQCGLLRDMPDALRGDGEAAAGASEADDE